MTPRLPRHTAKKSAVFVASGGGSVAWSPFSEMQAKLSPVQLVEAGRETQGPKQRRKGA